MDDLKQMSSENHGILRKQILRRNVGRAKGNLEKNYVLKKKEIKNCIFPFFLGDLKQRSSEHIGTLRKEISRRNVGQKRGKLKKTLF